MKLEKQAGATSEIWQVFVRDSSSTTGAGLTGLTNASASLTAYYHRDTDTTATAISLVTMTVGTFTSSGFKEIDATNMPGWYQFCPPNAALAAGAKSVGIHLKGATNMAPTPIEVQLVGYNPESSTVLLSAGTGTGQLDFTSGVVKANATQWLGGTIPAVNVTGVPLVDLKYTLGTISPAAAGSVGIDWAQVANKTSTVALTNTTVATATTVTNQLTAAQIATGVWTDTAAGDFTTALSVGKSVMNGVALGTGLTINDLTTKTGFSLSVAPPTSAAIATAVWGDTTAGDFTVSASIGKSVMNGVALGTGLTVNALTTNNDKTGYSLASGQKVDVDTIKTNPVVNAGTITFPTGATLASTTNITAGTITTATNLTNAPTAGDLTATMKTSVTTAATAATPTAAAVTGAVGSVTAGVTVTTNNDKAGYSLTQAFPSNFSALGISVGGHISNVDTLTTYTGNTPQTGDSYARIGAAGAGLTALGDTRIANLDATVSSRLATTGYTVPDNVSIATILNDVNVGAGAIYTRLGAPAGASIAADLAAVKSDSGGIKTKTDSLSFTIAGFVDSNVLDWKSATAPAMTGDAFARLGAPAGASVSADVAAVKSDTGAIKLSTDNLPSDPADESLIIAATDAVQSAIAALPTTTTVNAIKSRTDLIPNAPAAVSDIPTAIENADALLDRDLAAGTDTGSDSVRTVRQGIRISRNKVDISAGTMTVMKEDDVTPSHTAVVVTSASADPIISIDPAGP